MPENKNMKKLTRMKAGKWYTRYARGRPYYMMTHSLSSNFAPWIPISANVVGDFETCGRAAWGLDALSAPPCGPCGPCGCGDP